MITERQNGIVYFIDTSGNVYSFNSRSDIVGGEVITTQYYLNTFYGKPDELNEFIKDYLLSLTDLHNLGLFEANQEITKILYSIKE